MYLSGVISIKCGVDKTKTFYKSPSDHFVSIQNLEELPERGHQTIQRVKRKSAFSMLPKNKEFAHIYFV